MQEKMLSTLIGNRIKQTRESLNLTQENFGELIGLEQASLSNIENGKNLPSVYTLYSIIEKSKTNADFFFDTVDKYNKIKANNEIDYKIISYILNLSNKTKEVIYEIIKSKSL